MLGKYEDDVWLGQTGRRARSSPGEWPVAYHGTRESNLKGIVGNGLLTAKGKRFRWAIFGFLLYELIWKL